jgi:hypothetical protein
MPHNDQHTTAFANIPKRTRSIRSERRREKFAKVLCGKGRDRGGSVDSGKPYRQYNMYFCRRSGLISSSAELRRMSWSGIPEEFRHVAWQMLLVGQFQAMVDTESYNPFTSLQNYLPLPSQPRLTTLARKRKEYAQLVEQAFGRGMTPTDAQVSFWLGKGAEAVATTLLRADPSKFIHSPDMAPDRNRRAKDSSRSASVVMRGYTASEAAYQKGIRSVAPITNQSCRFTNHSLSRESSTFAPCGIRHLDTSRESMIS